MSVCTESCNIHSPLAPELGSDWVLLPRTLDTCFCSWGLVSANRFAQPLLHRRTLYCVAEELQAMWSSARSQTAAQSWEKLRNELLFATADIARSLEWYDETYCALDGVVVRRDGGWFSRRHHVQVSCGFRKIGTCQWRLQATGAVGSFLHRFRLPASWMSDLVWDLWEPDPSRGKKVGGNFSFRYRKCPWEEPA